MWFSMSARMKTLARILVIAAVVACGPKPITDPPEGPPWPCWQCHDKASKGQCQRRGQCKGPQPECEASGCAVVRLPPQQCGAPETYCVAKEL
jgi:hypothetical protein